MRLLYKTQKNFYKLRNLFCFLASLVKESERFKKRISLKVKIFYIRKEIKK